MNTSFNISPRTQKRNQRHKLARLGNQCTRSTSKLMDHCESVVVDERNRVPSRFGTAWSDGGEFKISKTAPCPLHPEGHLVLVHYIRNPKDKDLVQTFVDGQQIRW